MEQKGLIKEYVAVIDLGSRKITGVVAYRNEDGRFHVMASEIDGLDKPLIENGAVTSVSDTMFRIKQIIEKMQNVANIRIAHCTIGTSYSRNAITDIDKVIDGIHSAMGCRMVMAGNYSTALADILLTDEEKSNGALLVDMGHSTTSFVLYNNGEMKTSGMMRYGSSSITSDIMSLGIDADTAERYKIKMGITDKSTTANSKFMLNGQVHDIYSISDATAARVFETTDLVTDKLKTIKWFDNSNHSIVITGGGSNLPNVDKALLDRYGVSVRKATAAAIYDDAITGKDLHMADFATVAALLEQAVTGGCMEKEPVKKKRTAGTFWRELPGLFNTPDEKY